MSDPSPRSSYPDATVLAIERAVSQLVANYLAPETKSSLRGYRGGKDSQLQARLVDALNAVIESHDIWTKAELKKEEVDSLLPLLPPAAKSFSDLDRVCRNRILLFAAFPDSIASWVVTLAGSHFRPDSLVYLDGKELADDEKAQFVNSETLYCRLKYRQPGTISVVVRNPKHSDKPADDDGNSEAFNIDLPWGTYRAS